MDSRGNRRARKWIGLAHVLPVAGNTSLGECPGAFVAAVGLAADAEGFAQILAGELSQLGFDVVEVQDIDEFAKRTAKFRVDPEVARIAKSVNESTPIVLATFHAYGR